MAAATYIRSVAAQSSASAVAAQSSAAAVAVPTPGLAMQLADILKDGEASQWSDHNFALKAFRHRLLQEALDALTFPMMGRAVVMARKVQHDAKGPGFEVTDELLPWSWKDMLAAMKTDVQKRIVGPGIIAVSVQRRGPQSYDHAFAAVAVSKGWTWPGSDREPPPIVDFVVRRSDGSTICVHPRKKRGKVDIIVHGGVPVSTSPANGYGKSDGPGTFRRYRSGAYDPDAAFTPGIGHGTYPTAVAKPAGGGDGARAAVADQNAGSSDLPVVMGTSSGASIPPPQRPPPPPPQNNPRLANATTKAPPTHLPRPPPPPPPRPQQQPATAGLAVAGPINSAELAVAAPNSSSGPAVAAPSSSSRPAVAAPSSSSDAVGVHAVADSGGRRSYYGGCSSSTEPCFF